MLKRLLPILLFATTAALATVTSTETKRQYFTCNGSNDTFTFTMPVNSSDDITVELVLLSTGDPTTQVEDTDYTIAYTGSSYLEGGVVTMGTAPADTYQLVITREIERTQETVSGAINPASVETALDKVTRIGQDNRNDIEQRVIRIPDSDPTTAYAELTDYVSRKGYWLGFDSTTGAPYVGTPVASDANISSFMQTVLDDATAAGALTTLGAMGEVINVRAYGAYPDDGTDDTDEIQAAFDAGEAVSNNYIIYFPPGDYNTNAEIALEDMQYGLIYAYGAKISSTSDTNAVRFGEDTSTTQRFNVNTVYGLEISSTSATTLLYITGHQTTRNVFRDMILTGDATTPSNVTHGACLMTAGSQTGMHWNEFDNVSTEGCNYNFSIGYNFATTSAAADNPNRTYLNDCYISYFGTYGVWTCGNSYIYNIGSNNAVSGATADVYLTGNRSYVHGNFESTNATNAVKIASGSTNNVIEAFQWVGAAGVLDGNANAADTGVKSQSIENDIRMNNSTWGNLHAIDTLRALTWLGYGGQHINFRIADSKTFTVQDVNGNNLFRINEEGAWYTVNERVITATDSTPSVVSGNIFDTNNATSGTITDFDGGTTGQIITVAGGDSGLTTLQHNAAKMNLRNGLDFTPQDNDTMTLYYDGTDWNEKCRSRNTTARTLTADSDSDAGSTINEGDEIVNVTAVTTNANDWIVLPSVTQGNKITVYCNASSNFEVRTPADSDETINGEDCDGTKEYLATNTDIIIFDAHLSTGWIGRSYQADSTQRVVTPD